MQWVTCIVLLCLFISMHVKFIRKIVEIIQLWRCLHNLPETFQSVFLVVFFAHGVYRVEHSERFDVGQKAELFLDFADNIFVRIWFQLLSHFLKMFAPLKELNNAFVCPGQVRQAQFLFFNQGLKNTSTYTCTAFHPIFRILYPSKIFVQPQINRTKQIADKCASRCNSTDPTPVIN